jgi:hypothetical protein
VRTSIGKTDDGGDDRWRRRNGGASTKNGYFVPLSAIA